MSVLGYDPYTPVAPAEPAVRRLGERTCVIDVGTELRHIELPGIDDAIRTLLIEGGRDLVFDLAREWDRLEASGCEVHVGTSEPRVVADLERLVDTTGWELHPSLSQALSALLSAPVN
jgi:hypothetical protein